MGARERFVRLYPCLCHDGICFHVVDTRVEFAVADHTVFHAVDVFAAVAEFYVIAFSLCHCC